MQHIAHLPDTLPFPGPLSNSINSGKAPVWSQNPQLDTGPITWIYLFYPGNVVSGELNSLQEQNTLSQNAQETKPTPATASLPNEF